MLSTQASLDVVGLQKDALVQHFDAVVDVWSVVVLQGLCTTSAVALMFLALLQLPCEIQQHQGLICRWACHCTCSCRCSTSSLVNSGDGFRQRR